MRKNKPRHRSLLCFVQALEGYDVTIELRNDSEVQGNVHAVDDAMK